MHAIIFTGYEKTGGIERVSGAYRIATVLRQEGWDIEVVDFFYYWNINQLKDLIKIRNQKHKIDWIGFSLTWINYSSEPVQQMMIDFLKHVKLNYPDIVTIGGGQNPSTHFSMYDDIDYIINGFGEVAVKEVLKYIYSNGIIKGIPRKNGWFVDANAFYQAWPISDLSVEYEPRDFVTQNETLALEFSRGCKFACTFCNFPVLGVKEDTTRDLTNLKSELQKNYDLYGSKNYQIADETLNDRDEKLVKIGQVVNELSFKPNFDAFIRGDILFSRPQQLELLSNARVWGHYYGIETFNHETGKAIGKGLHPDKIKQGLIDTRDYFYKQNEGYFRGTVSLIYGLPKETPESILSGLDWLCKNWKDQNVIAFPLNLSLTGKKSKLDENYKKYGYSIIGQEKRKLYNRHNLFSNDLTIWKNEHMSMYDAIDLVDTEIKEFKPGFLDCWKLFGMISLTDTIEDALLLNESESEIGGKLVPQEPLRNKANLIKAQYIQSKLSL